jgi:SPOR domain
MQSLNPKRRTMSGAKQESALPLGIWMLVGGLSAVMFGYMLGGVLTTSNYLDFLLPHAAVPVSITTDNDGPLRATPMGPSGQAPTSAEPPSAPPGKIVVQVAAVVREDHARALANALKQKGFPAFVRVANADTLFRVQVGPYTDRQSAQPTALALEGQGLQVFIRSP